MTGAAVDEPLVGADELALFPLNTVLFPGGPLPLRIFEARYQDMTSHCLRHDRGFGVCLIRSGEEAGRPAEPHPLGTLARIVDWHRYDDGLLGLTARGESRFRIRGRRVARNGLLVAQVEALPSEPSVPVPPDYRGLVPVLRELMDRRGPLYEGVPRHFEDATWVGYRLAEILPLDLPLKRHLLEMETAIERLDDITRAVRALGVAEAR